MLERTPSIPGHELAGVVTALDYGTTGMSIGQRVFGLTDWYRDGTMAEYVAVDPNTKRLRLRTTCLTAPNDLGNIPHGQRISSASA